MKNEEYIFFYEGKRIMIKTGMHTDFDGTKMHFAYTDFKGIHTLAECREKALETCVKRIKFAILLSKKEIKLMKQEQATVLAKKYFEENYTHKASIEKYYDTLSYGVSVEDEILTFVVLNSDSCNLTEDSKPDIVAVIYVNLLTGECSMIEKRGQLK